MKINKTIIFFLIIHIYCSNYTSKPLAINPPLILSTISGSSNSTQITGIEKTSTGHILRVAAQNTEYTFKTYRIFQASSENEVLSQTDSSGIDCSYLIQLPNTANIQIMEASLNPLGLATLCVFPINLTTGSYVSLRAVYISNLDQTTKTSLPSNAVIVP